MKDHYELKNPRKNPYAERMKNGYRIIIDREKIEVDEELLSNVEITKQNQIAEHSQVIVNR